MSLMFSSSSHIVFFAAFEIVTVISEDVGFFSVYIFYLEMDFFVSLLRVFICLSF